MTQLSDEQLDQLATRVAEAWYAKTEAAARLRAEDHYYRVTTEVDQIYSRHMRTRSISLFWVAVGVVGACLLGYLASIPIERWTS